MSREGLNYKGKLASSVGRLLGKRVFQPFLDKTQVLLLGTMNIGGATRSHYASGEVDVMRLVKNSYDPSEELTIFDVGAHRGDYAQTLQEIFGKRVRIFCFEPCDRLFLELKAKLTTDAFRLYNLGLGHENSMMSLFTSDNLIPTLFKQSYEITGQSIVGEERIRIKRLDDFCREEEIPNIHFMKVDVEGFEHFVLQGAGDLVRSAKIDFIQFEFGPHSIASRTYMNDFFQLLDPNYRISRILRGGGLYELPSYSPNLEIFASATNYLACSRKRSKESGPIDL